MTLWKVMRQFETTEKGLNVTAKSVPRGTNSGQLYFEAPVVNIMGREYSDLEDLQKTLSQCGISSGSIVLRVSFKSTEKTLFDAMQEIGQYLNDVEPDQMREENAAPSAETSQADAAPAADGPNPEATEPEITEEVPPSAPVESSTAPVPMEVDEPPAETVAPADPLQPTGVFSAPSSATPAATRIHEDDSVYEPTIAHAQLRQQQLLQRGQNTRLKSDAELAADAANEAARLAKITKVEVKVRFPDQTSAVWVVTPDETGSFLYQAIRGVMAHPSQSFKLIIPGPKTAIQENDKRLIATYRLKGRELMHLVWEDSVSSAARKEPFLKVSVASKAQEVVVPKVPEGAVYEADEAVAGPSSRKPVNSGKEKSLDSEAVKKKLSKFLGLGKK
jgi:tether containing UBX domain for GLUT4